MRLLFFIFLALFPTTSQAQNFGETREYFSDWLAACRPNGYCSATTYVNPRLLDTKDTNANTAADYVLRVGRHETGTYWEISLTTIAAMPAEYANIVIDIEGAQTTFNSRFGYGAYSSVNDFFFLSTNAQQILDQMVAGNRAIFEFEGEDSLPKTANFSLSGLSASLIWIDEKQRRLGSERVVYAAPIGLTPVSAEFPRSVPPQLIVQHTQNPDCDAFEDLPGAHRVITEQVDEEHYIYLIPCATGAYNSEYKAYEGNDDYFTPVYFAEFSETGGWSGTPFIVNPTYDYDTNILTSKYFGRSLGDCGSAGKWVWDTEYYRFAMLEYRLKERCDGQGEPGVFPLVFKSKSPPASLDSN